METKSVKLTTDELDSILSLRNLVRENVEKVGKLNIQRHFLDKEVEFVNEQLGALYQESMQLGEKEKLKIDEIVAKYGEGKLDFASGIYTID
jgi:hypothetical protein